MGLDVIITGANRGIGLGFTQHYLSRGDRVIATYRSKKSLDHLTEVRPGKFTCLSTLKKKYPKQLMLQRLDVTSEEHVAQFAATVEKLDLLILNAGIKGYSVPGTKTKDHPPGDLRAAIEVNTLAPNHIWSCFYSLIAKTPNAGVIFMGSLVGLPKDNTSGDYHPYRLSKTASHHMMWNLFLQLIQDWRMQAVESLRDDPSLTHLQDSIRAVLPDSFDKDLYLEIIGKALMTTHLMPKFQQHCFGTFRTAYFKEWLESVFPEVPLKKLLHEKILNNLLQQRWNPGISAKDWILQVLEKTCLIDALKEPIEEALTSPSSIEKLTSGIFEPTYQDLLEIVNGERPWQVIHGSDIKKWALNAMIQVPSLDKELKGRIVEVITETPHMQQWRTKMIEILRNAPFAAAICAGWVRTDMGGPYARLSIHDSTAYMMVVIELLRRTKQGNGLLMYDGTMPEKYPIPSELEEIFYAIKNSREASTSISTSSSSS
jgi:NAD(P)-dependent dehydrogenase (short-subunit alcohol dehydrogenase family)